MSPCFHFSSRAAGKTAGVFLIFITSKFSKFAKDSGRDFRFGLSGMDKNCKFFNPPISSGMSCRIPSMCSTFNCGKSVNSLLGKGIDGNSFLSLVSKSNLVKFLGNLSTNSSNPYKAINLDTLSLG